MREPPERHVRLVVVDRGGGVLGALPPFPVDVPWWQEAGPVVRAARERHGAEITVLRMLEVDSPGFGGGLVTYLVEAAEPPANLEPWKGALDDHPLRLPWARPGGPAADIAWADEELERAGLRRTGPAVQVRSWNLSSLWRMPVEGSDGGEEVETVWLKHVPPFFGHEGAILERLAGAPVPRLIAREGPRILLHEIPGRDLYDAELDILERLVDVLVGLQRSWIGRTNELLALGLPDWRPPALSAAIARAVERTAPELAEDDRRTLGAFVDALPRRFEAVSRAGLPETLVHGDFHPGNARGDGTTLTLLDWGDCGVGHPLLDEAAYLDRIGAGNVDPVRGRWHQRWREAVPGSDPALAARLLGPVAAACQAVIYRMFIDGIEPSEHPYHAGDAADWLGRTAALVRSEG